MESPTAARSGSLQDCHPQCGAGLQRNDAAVADHRYRDETRARCDTTDAHGARPARANATAVLRTVDLESFAEHREQWRLWIGGHAPALAVHVEHVCHRAPRESTSYASSN